MAGLTVLNLGLANRADEADTTLDLISVMAQAYDEGGEGGMGACPEGTGGYETTGERDDETKTRYKMTWNAGSGMEFSLFDLEQGALGFLQTVLEFGGTMTPTFFAQYTCTGTPGPICWVCNWYEVGGGGSPE